VRGRDEDLDAVKNVWIKAPEVNIKPISLVIVGEVKRLVNLFSTWNTALNLFLYLADEGCRWSSMDQVCP